MDEAAIRRIINNAVATTIAASRQPPALPGPSGPPGPAGPADPAGGSEAAAPTSRQNTNDLGFFDPHYNDKIVHSNTIIEHANKDTYFRDIYLFINRTKQFISIKESKIIRNNL